MSTDLNDLVESLKRVMAVPGTFEDAFPDTTDEDLKFTLMDAFAECQMDQLLTGMTLGSDGIVSKDLTRAQQAVVVLYANARVISTVIRNLKTRTKYQSGSNLYEVEQGASTLVEQLKMLQASKQQILKSQNIGAGIAFSMRDAYWDRLYCDEFAIRGW